MCIFTVKIIIKYYTGHNTPVYTCFLDASEAFDRFNHLTLFKNLLMVVFHSKLFAFLYFGTKHNNFELNGVDQLQRGATRRHFISLNTYPVHQWIDRRII